MNACRRVWGVTRLSIPARLASRRTIRAGAWRSRRAVPSRFKRIGPSLRSPMHKSMARPVRGASGMVTMAPPFLLTVRGAMPSYHSQVFDVCAEGFGDPQTVQANRDARAWSRPPLIPAWTKSMPTSFRSSRAWFDS